MKLRTYSTLLLLVGLISSFGAAQEYPINPTGQTGAEPTLIDGQPIIWKFSKSKVARAVSYLNTPKVVSVGLTLTKNTCNSAPIPRCQLRNKIQQRSIGIVWEKHPNKKLIGTVLKRDSSMSPTDSRREPTPSDTLYVDSYIISAFAKKYWALRGLDLVTDEDLTEELVCDQFEWLPRQKDGQIKMSSWLTIFEFGNVELGMGFDVSNVNQFLVGAHGVQLIPVDPNTMLVGPIRSPGAALDFGFMSPVFGYQTSMSFNRAANGVENTPSQGRMEWSDPECRLDFTINFGELFTAFTKLSREYELPNLENSRPVKFNMSDPQVRTNINSMFTDRIYVK